MRDDNSIGEYVDNLIREKISTMSVEQCVENFDVFLDYMEKLEVIAKKDKTLKKMLKEMDPYFEPIFNEMKKISECKELTSFERKAALDAARGVSISLFKIKDYLINRLH